MQRLRTSFIGGIVEDDPLTSGALTLTSQGLSALPEVTDGLNYIAIVLDPDGLYGGAPEIVWITEHDELSDTATILREQEGTTAREHNNDTYWVHAPTAHDWNNMFMVVNTDGDDGTTVYVGSVDPETLGHVLFDGDIWLRTV
jgi:hypothetical protein